MPVKKNRRVADSVYDNEIDNENSDEIFDHLVISITINIPRLCLGSGDKGRGYASRNNYYWGVLSMYLEHRFDL